MDPSWSNKVVDSILGADGRSLMDMGVNNWVLNRKDALIAIEKLKIQNIAVLGGDVYLLSNEAVESTYDGWHCEPEPLESHTSFILRSAAKATEYISNYIKESDNILFAIVPKTHLINDGTGRFY